MSDGLDTAIAERERKRERFRTSLATARERLKPKALAHDAIAGARGKAEQAAESLVETVRKRPAATAGIVAAAALLLFRKPIIGAIKRLTKEK